jgi:hypothetical protein
MENFNKRRFVALSSLVVVAVLAYFIFTLWDHGRLGKVIINVAPGDSTVKLNSSKVIGPGAIYLKPGRYTVTASRNGFRDDTEAVTAEKGKTATIYLVPEPMTQAAFQYLQNNPSAQTEREGLASQKVAATQALLQSKYPIIKYLPLTTRYYSINYGQSKKSPNDPTALALYISSNPAYRDLALQWIKYKGFDPSKFEIIYQDTQ